MKILKTLKEVANISKRAKRGKKKVGLVIGGFDILHMGHLKLFRLAKRHVDVLIVGLDNDETLKATKGKNRPINNYSRRSQFLSDLSTVDFVFKIPRVFKYNDLDVNNYFDKLYKKISPTHVFTHSATDGFSTERREMAKRLGIKFVNDTTKRVTNSSEIIKKLERELYLTQVRF